MPAHGVLVSVTSHVCCDSRFENGASSRLGPSVRSGKDGYGEQGSWRSGSVLDCSGTEFFRANLFVFHFGMAVNGRNLELMAPSADSRRRCRGGHGTGNTTILRPEFDLPIYAGGRLVGAVESWDLPGHCAGRPSVAVGRRRPSEKSRRASASMFTTGAALGCLAIAAIEPLSVAAQCIGSGRCRMCTDWIVVSCVSTGWHGRRFETLGKLFDSGSQRSHDGKSRLGPEFPTREALVLRGRGNGTYRDADFHSGSGED